MPENQTPVRSILLDVEGTTSSISFVYDVMFPYVREHLQEYLDNHWTDDAVQNCVVLLRTDIEAGSDWPAGDDGQQREAVAAAVIDLMDRDIKATGLKQIQGLIWKNGFESGAMVAHLFDDVAQAMRDWESAGLDLRIYSSGSIAAQKLFFGHSVAGNLLPLISGHYDTTTGGKKEKSSYEIIAGEIGMAAVEVLFISDVAEELIAAEQAGMQTLLSVRPGNKPVDNKGDFTSIASFAEVANVCSLAKAASSTDG